MYQNPYYNNFNQPIPQQPITQNFQLSPTHTGMRFVNSIDDVRKDLVYFETPYFSRDMRFMWIKNVKGEVTPYEIKKIEYKDEKDLQMEQMKREIEELKERLNEKSSITNDTEPVENEKSSNVSNVKSRKN
ncbi:MAG: hypothetical protein IKO78_02630 [Bacilli bacterium]|nr:hypothetical protein [Bacilli bacterium]